MDALIVIAVVVGLVWATLFVLRGSLLTGCLAFLLVNACFGYYFYNFEVGTANMTLDRPVLFLVGVAYVIQRFLGRTSPKPLSWSDGVAFAFVGWLAIRTLEGDWSKPNAELPTALWLLLSGFVGPLALYWIARQSPLNEGAIRKIQLFFVALGIYLSITAILEISQQWWLVFPQHIADPTLAQHFGRARGPMVNSMSLGFFLTICLLCAWNYRDRLGLRGQVLMAVLCLLSLLGLYLTYTRVVWIGVTLSIVVVAWLTMSRRVALAGTMCVLFAGALVAATKGEELWSLDSGRAAAHTRDSSDMRLSFNYVAWQMFLDRPLLGWGFGQYVFNSPMYLSDRTTELVLERTRGAPVHNEFMSILVETGPLGLLLFVALLGTWAYQGWKLWGDAALPSWARTHGLLMMALVAAYCAHGVFHPVGHTYTVQFALFFLAGIGVGLRQTAPAVRRLRIRSSPSAVMPQRCVSPSL